MQKRFIVIVGTSGSGKTTIINLLKERHPEFYFPSAFTTRKPRPGEIPGTNYDFISRDEFEQHINDHTLLEWAVNHSKEYYGMLRHSVEEALDEGTVVIREMSIAGLRETLKTDLAEQVYSIFLTPPSLEQMKARILKRSHMDEEEIERRMNSSKKEIEDSHICDITILAEENEVEKIYQQVDEAISKAVQGI